MMHEEQIIGKPVTIAVPAVNTWGITALRNCCKKHKVKGYSTMDKKQLIHEVEQIIKNL